MAAKSKREKPTKVADLPLEDHLRIALAGPLALANPAASAGVVAAKIEDQVAAIMRARKG